MAHVAPETLEGFLPRLWPVWKATLRKATISTRRSVLRHYAGVLRGPMRDLTQVEAEAALLSRLADGRALISVRGDAAVLSSAWALAVRMGVARANPWRGLKLPRPEVEAHRRLSDVELETLYSAAPAALLPALLLMGEAGLRRNEVVTLLWGDIAADRRTVTVRAAVAKSRKSRRIPLNARTAAAVDAAGPGLPSAKVCPFRTARLNFHFRTLADSVGLTDATPHTLRHTAAHRWAEAGVSLYVIRDLLGHSSVQQTEVYAAQATADTMRAAVDHADTRRDSSSRSTSERST